MCLGFGVPPTPTDIPEVVIEVPTMATLDVVQKFFGNKKSKSDIRRLFQQGAVSQNGVKITDLSEQVTLSEGDVFQVGKRVWFKIRLQ